MIFAELALKGAFLIEPERLEDERGFFARTFCGEEFAAHGLVPTVAQCNVSYNRRRGTLRGLHFQSSPGQAKLVRATRGRVWDARKRVDRAAGGQYLPPKFVTKTPQPSRAPSSPVATRTGLSREEVGT